MSLPRARLGVNIDHVATVRNARGGIHPLIGRAAMAAEWGGADGITMHLREDRRHILDPDLLAVREATDLPINLEMAATEEMLDIARHFKPRAACIVPEKREERTTEGGLDAVGAHNQLAPIVAQLRDEKIRVSLFIEPSSEQVKAAQDLGARVVEFHTGRYCDLVAQGEDAEAQVELGRLKAAAVAGTACGLEVHMGHGITFETVGEIAAIPEVRELNIGHFLVGEALFVGLEAAVRRMKELIDAARETPA
ncbi:MAG: pyridoxine 5'-phosphate synthase [Hyphomonadaceae bacterium]